MSRSEYDANEAMSAGTWQNRQGRPQEWQREVRPVHGAGVVYAAYWFVIFAAIVGFSLVAA